MCKHEYKTVFSKSVGDGHKPRTPVAAGSTLKLSTDFPGDCAPLPAPFGRSAKLSRAAERGSVFGELTRAAELTVEASRRSLGRLALPLRFAQSPPLH